MSKAVKRSVSAGCRGAGGAINRNAESNLVWCIVRNGLSDLGTCSDQDHSVGPERPRVVAVLDDGGEGDGGGGAKATVATNSRAP